MVKLRIAAIVAALVVAAGTAVAQDYANIVIANKIVARIRTGGSYGSIYARQAKIDQRVVDALSDELDNIFSQDHDGPAITVYRSGGLWALAIGDVMLIRAYPEDAAPLGISTKELAYQWKENFRQQFPRAVAPSKVPQWWKDAHPDEVGGNGGFQSHGLPDADVPLVREIVAMFDAARRMSDEEFGRLRPVIQRAIIAHVWSYRRASCGPPPGETHIRVKSALTRVRAVDDDKYAAEKYMVAGLTITKLREVYHIPAGAGPAPAQRPLPDFEAGPTPPGPPGPVAPPPPRFVPGTPIRQASLGTGLDANSRLLNSGQVFGADMAQLLVYLHVQGAPANTIVGLTVHRGTDIVGRRLLRVAGEKRLAVTFYPAQAEAFAPGEYECRLTVNGEDAGAIPFRVIPISASMLGG